MIRRRLVELLSAAKTEYRLFGKTDVSLAGIRMDSRRIEPGYAFTAVKGLHHDGNLYWPDALKKGAVGVISQEMPPSDFSLDTYFWITTPDPIGLTGELLSGFMDLEGVTFIGVTGTNGKSSITFWAHYLDPHGGSVGTTGVWFGRKNIIETLHNTTPMPDRLWESIWKLMDLGAKRIYVEVSSHGIRERRIAGIPFSWTIFTNLEPEHRDAHPDLEEYFAVKSGFVLSVPEDRRVIGLQDHWGRRLFRISGKRSVTFGLSPDADFSLWRWRRDGGLKLECVWKTGNNGMLRAKVPFVSSFFLYNLTGVLAVLEKLGVDLSEVARYLETMQKPEGRFELLECDGRIVVLDYAHTPRAIEALLMDVRTIFPGRRILTVVGAVGSGDRIKRAKIGIIASKHSDKVFLSPHNPKGEPSDKLLADILGGVPKHYMDRVVFAGHRRDAILEAWKCSQEGDVLVIAGRGRETAYITENGDENFSDLDVLGELGLACRDLERLDG